METRKLSELKANPLNPRGEVTHDVPLRELAASIKVHGVLQPILVTPDGTIVAGHRRVVAARLAGLSDIPVIARDLTETAQLQVMLVENIQRNDLTLLQTAKAYQALTQRGLTADLIATAIGVTKRSVAEHLMIFKLPIELHQYFDNGKLGLRTVPRLLELNAGDQLRIGLEAVEKGWGEIKVGSAVHRIKTPSPNGHTTKRSLLDRIWERVEDGCYTPETIKECSECGRDIFNLSDSQIRDYLQRLVNDGRAEWRKQGGKKEATAGVSITLCVPADMPSGEIEVGGRNRLAAGNQYTR